MHIRQRLLVLAVLRVEAHLSNVSVVWPLVISAQHRTCAIAYAPAPTTPTADQNSSGLLAGVGKRVADIFQVRMGLDGGSVQDALCSISVATAWCVSAKLTRGGEVARS